MGVPYFQVKVFCKKNNVRVFSFNYTLYADMLHHLMTTLETLCPYRYSYHFSYLLIYFEYLKGLSRILSKPLSDKKSM